MEVKGYDKEYLLIKIVIKSRKKVERGEETKRKNSYTIKTRGCYLL